MELNYILVWPANNTLYMSGCHRKNADKVLSELRPVAPLCHSNTFHSADNVFFVETNGREERDDKSVCGGQGKIV